MFYVYCLVMVVSFSGVKAHTAKSQPGTTVNKAPHIYLPVINVKKVKKIKKTKGSSIYLPVINVKKIKKTKGSSIYLPVINTK